LPDIDGLSTPELLGKLRLAQGGKLKRAAIVLFGKDPGKFYPNTFVKTGKFEDDDFTIRFQEVEEGNIIQVLDKVLRTLDYKFLIRNISFEGMNRVETLEYPIHRHGLGRVLYIFSPGLSKHTVRVGYRSYIIIYLCA
jgi:ATP-dependent DNA helicase RecG